MDSAGKRSSQKPAHGPPLQARVAAANGTVLTTPNDDPGAHGHEQGAKQHERGKLLRRAVGMAWQRRAGKHSPQDKAAAGKHSRQTMQPAQALKQNNSQQMAGLAAKQQPQTTLAGLSPCSAGWWRECGGAGHSEGGLGPTYLSPSHLSPLPVTVHHYPLP